MRWILLVSITLFATACVVPRPRAKACATCKARPASRATHVK